MSVRHAARSSGVGPQASSTVTRCGVTAGIVAGVIEVATFATLATFVLSPQRDGQSAKTTLMSRLVVRVLYEDLSLDGHKNNESCFDLLERDDVATAVKQLMLFVEKPLLLDDPSAGWIRMSAIARLTGLKCL